MSVRAARAPELVPCPLALVPCRCSSPACGGAASGTRFLSIATGGTGGVYYPYGGGLAKVLNENLPGVRATAEVTAASVDNLKLIRDGRADLAFTLADTLADAVAGRGAFEGRSGAGRRASPCSIRTTRTSSRSTSSGIRTVADLRGQGRLDRIARQRHRGDRVPGAASGRARSRSRPHAAGLGVSRVGRAR